MDPRPFRERYAVDDRDVLLITVSRFAESLKGESLRRTIDAVRTLGRDLSLKLLLVGDGMLRPELQQLADAANAELGRAAVALTGVLLDPRPAYAAADLVVGMGGSALRAMAFGKPVVVVGEHGFSVPFNPQTAESLYYKGFGGVGDGFMKAGRARDSVRAYDRALQLDPNNADVQQKAAAARTKGPQ